MSELAFPDPPLADACCGRVAGDVDAAREGVLRAFQERDGRRLDVVTFSLLRQDLR